MYLSCSLFLKNLRKLENFCLASSINPSTSSLDLLKLSTLNAYTVTSLYAQM